VKPRPDCGVKQYNDHGTIVRLVTPAVATAGTAQASPPLIAPAPPAAPPKPTADERVDVVETGWRQVLVVLGVMLAALLQTLDSTIVNVALPTVQGNLGASIDEGAWVVTAYIIAAVIVIPVTPWLQSRFGRKQYFLVSIAGFTIASLACGLASTIQELIVFRVVQGLFGGGLLATSQAILRDTFPARQFGLSQAIYTFGAVVGPSAGPTIGGILTDNYSWRWVFDVNVVPGIVAILLLAPLLRNPTKPRASGFDGMGLVLLAIGLGSLQYVLDEGERNDWFSDPAILLCSVAAVVGIAAFVVWELKGAKRPIVDLSVLFRRNIAIGCLAAMLNASMIFGVLLVFPQYLTGVLGFTATQDGYLLAIRALPIFLLTIPIGLYVNSGKIDPRYLLVGGLATGGAGLIGLAFVTTSHTEFGTMVPWLILSGTGIAFVFTPLLVAVLRSVAPSDSPKAGAFISLALNLGGSLTSASLVTFLDRRETFHGSVLGDAAVRSNPQVATLLAQPHGLATLAALVEREAATMSYADTFFALGALAILFAGLGLAIKPPPKRSPG
jgi:MFS transporter, DHA2 family, multidrug resistance protein